MRRTFVRWALDKAVAHIRDGETEGWDRLTRWQKATLLECLTTGHHVIYYPQYKWTGGGTENHPAWICHGCGTGGNCYRKWVLPW